MGLILLEELLACIETLQASVCQTNFTLVEFLLCLNVETFKRDKGTCGFLIMVTEHGISASSLLPQHLLTAMRFITVVSVTGASCCNAEWLPAVIHAWPVLFVAPLF